LRRPHEPSAPEEAPPRKDLPPAYESLGAARSVYHTPTDNYRFCEATTSQRRPAPPPDPFGPVNDIVDDLIVFDDGSPRGPADAVLPTPIQPTVVAAKQSVNHATYVNFQSVGGERSAFSPVRISPRTPQPVNPQSSLSNSPPPAFGPVQ